jgi:hypothetical protein
MDAGGSSLDRSGGLVHVLHSLVGEIDGCHATRWIRDGAASMIFSRPRWCTSSAMQLGTGYGSCKYLPSTARSVILQCRVCSSAFKSGMPAHNLVGLVTFFFHGRDRLGQAVGAGPCFGENRAVCWTCKADPGLTTYVLTDLFYINTGSCLTPSSAYKRQSLAQCLRLLGFEADQDGPSSKHHTAKH